MSKLNQLKRQLKAVEKKMQKVRDENPRIDFAKTSDGMAWKEYMELIRAKIFLEVDVKFCASENRREMCEGCACWKMAAAKHEGRT